MIDSKMKFYKEFFKLNMWFLIGTMLAVIPWVALILYPNIPPMEWFIAGGLVFIIGMLCIALPIVYDNTIVSIKLNDSYKNKNSDDYNMYKTTTTEIPLDNLIKIEYKKDGTIVYYYKEN